MPNNYFRFKQFTIYQDACAMKVCTDACLFGSTLPAAQKGNEWHVLDIGTGTGLLSLMYAQKNANAFIDAVEIDQAAAMQASQNFSASPWHERLNIHQVSIQQFDLPGVQPYDLIICNPPFFENDLKSPDNKRNLALHNDALSFYELIAAAKKLLKINGCLSVLVPYPRADYFITLAAYSGLNLSEKILVRQTPAHSWFRSILSFSKQTGSARHKQITIKEKDGNYSAGFRLLLADYYLHF